VFIVEMLTTEGPLCEPYATYEEARRRVELFPAESLIGLPLIFEELADGSQRIVRDDGKPLQWHRLPDDSPQPDEPLPLCDDSFAPLGDGKWVPIERPPMDEFDL
jgi:hypothetical protein